MTDVLLTTTKFRVERREFAGPGGEPIVREIVVHPGAVVILPILDGDRVVMVRNYRHSVGAELLELPAGTCEPDEEPIETAFRELIEETGYRAGSLTPMGEFYTSPGVMTELMHAYLASNLTHVGQNPEPGELVAPEICELPRLRELLVRAGFRDAKTLAVLGIYFATLNG